MACGSTIRATNDSLQPSASNGPEPVEGHSGFLRLQSGLIYIGCSLDLERRLEDHLSGKACRTTRLDRAVAILRIEVCLTFSEARQREAQLKRWSRAKKEALISGNIHQLGTLSRSRET